MMFRNVDIVFMEIEGKKQDVDTISLTTYSGT